MRKSTFKLAGREWVKITWWQQKGMRSTYIYLLAAVMTSATNGYDGPLMTGLQANNEWLEYFHFPSPSSVGMLTAAMSVGSILAIPVVPYTADMFGRRAGVAIGCTITLAGVAMLSMGLHISLFIIGRLIIGFGVAITHGSAPLLKAELVHPQHRAIYSTVYNALWYVGSLISAWIMFGMDEVRGEWSWRIPCLIQAIPSLMQIIFIWFVPESPRWLISKGKQDQALKVLAYVHAQGDNHDELVQVEYEEIHKAVALELRYDNAWSELWSTSGNRHRLLILVSIGLFSQWSGNAFITYYLTEVLWDANVRDDKTVLEIKGYLSIVQLVSAVGVCFFVDKLGRRTLFIASCIGMFISFVAETIVFSQFIDIENENGAYPKGVIAFIFLYFIFYNLGFSGLLVSYSTEILPYKIRAKGLAVMFFFADVALCFSQFIDPIALDKISWRYYIVYIVWIVFELFVIWKWYLETKDTPLEEIVKLFDGDIGAASEKAGHRAADGDFKPIVTDIKGEQSSTTSEAV